MRKLITAVVGAGVVTFVMTLLARDERLTLFWHLSAHSQCHVPEGAGRWVKVMATKGEDGQIHVLCWQQDFEGSRRRVDKEYSRILNQARKEVDLTQ